MKIKLLSKNFLAIVLSFAVLASTLMLQTFAEGAGIDSWQNHVESGFAAGSGTDTDPYQIATAEQLALLGKYIVDDAIDTLNNDNDKKYKEKSYILTADIYLNDVSPSGGTPWYECTDRLKKWNYGAGAVNNANYFNGKLDGNGHVIRGIYIDTEDKCAGLFIGFMGQVVIKNLGIESSYIKSTSSSSNVGAIVGRINNNGRNTVDISNSYVADSVILTGKNVGGFAGEHGNPAKVTITNCYSSPQINATGHQGAFEAGIGEVKLLTMKKCFSTLETANSKPINFVGFGFENQIYENCYTVAGTAVGITKLYNSDKTKSDVKKMKGEAAKENMPALNYTHKWKTRENDIPQLKVFYNRANNFEDLNNPTLSDKISAAGLSKTTAAVIWEEATEDITAPEDMVYTVYKSENRITNVTDPGVEKFGSCTADTNMTVTGLEIGKEYYFAVVATDESGKSSAPLIMKQAYKHSYSPSDDWDGTVADGFTVGNGSAENPYMILNAEQLAYLVDLSNSKEFEATSGKYYTLNVDVNLKNENKEWTVGTADFPDESGFCGIFNGNNHIIKGLYIKKDAKTYNGLFAAMTNAATVKNLGIENSYIAAGEIGYAGAIAGVRNSKTADDGVVVENVYVGSDVTLEGGYTGGFFGTVLKDTAIKNSYSKVDVKGKTSAGTLIGDHTLPNIMVTVDGCYSINPTIPMVALTGKYSKVTYNNSYTVGADAEGLATRTLEQMTGNEAMQYMRGFDFDSVWHIVENDTPVLASFVPKTDYSAVKWDGTVATGFAGGDGTDENPYKIANAAQLAFLCNSIKLKTADTVNGGYYTTKSYVLTNDIILNDISKGDDGTVWYNRTDTDLKPWTYGELTDWNNVFTGKFNGGGHTVKGIYINRTTQTTVSESKGYAGLFSLVGNNAVIENLGIEYSYMKEYHSESSRGRVGAISPQGRYTGTITINNCYVADTVILDGRQATGGFFAVSEAKLKITNCYSEVNITATAGNRGTFAGGLGDQLLELENSYSTSTAFGFVGYNIQNQKYSYCYSVNTDGINQYWTDKWNDIDGITRLDANSMKGAAAKANMLGFDFDGTATSSPIWRIKAGNFPKLAQFPDESEQTIDEQNPQFFEGDIQAIDATKISITVAWPEAKDNYTPNAFIKYKVYYSELPIKADNVTSATPLDTYGYAREATLTVKKLPTLGLESKIYFAVVAMDEAGNETFMATAEPISPKASKNEVWQGGVARFYESGSGTEKDPYIIANAEQLAYFVKNANKGHTKPKDNVTGQYITKYFAIDNDITLNDVSVEKWYRNDPNEWAYGISVVNNSQFYGNLDGRGHVIKGLYINAETARAALICGLQEDGVIQNLGIIESYISVKYAKSSCEAAAIIARRHPSMAGDGAKLLQCFVDETVEITTECTAKNGTSFAGGLIGCIQHGMENTKTKTLVKDCYSGAILTAKTVGMICGNSFNSNVKDEKYKDKDTLIFENCFSTSLSIDLSYDYLKFLSLPPSQKDHGRMAVYKNCFAARDNNDEGVAKIDIINMIGKNADKYITGLDYSGTWITTEDGTPMLRIFGDHPEYAINRLPVTIRFNTNGANEINPLVGYVGDKITLPTITREGFEFEGWYVYSADSSLKYPIDFYPAFDMVLHAKWRDLATLRVDFEKYPYTIPGDEGLGEDHVFYRPGVDGYTSEYVRNGLRSMHRLGDLDTEHSFQLFDLDSNTLEVGKKYELTMWVYADKVTSGNIMLESSDRLIISKKSTVIGDIADVTTLKQGEWQQVKYEFTAQNKYALIRTSGSNSLYFDDISIYEKGVGNSTGIANDNLNLKTGESNAIVIGLVVLALSALMMAVVILLRRKNSKENSKR